MNLGQKKTILLVENEKIIAMVEKFELECIGYKVIAVNSGEDSIKILEKENSIDLILMDIDLGQGMDGIETAKTILKNKKLPVVFLSSHIEHEIIERAKNISSYGYVVKNSGVEVLEASIQMAFKTFAGTL